MKKLHKEFMNVVDCLVKKKLKENSDIKLIILAGSVAQAEETEHSDIDINFFTEKKHLPSFPRAFYKYKGKYIEETFIPLEEFKVNGLSSDARVLFDKEGLTKNKKTNYTQERKRIFLQEWKKAKRYFELAEMHYRQGNYEKSLVHLVGAESIASVLAHALPPRFDLPWPSFRLFKAIKKISNKFHDKKIYDNLAVLYRVKKLNKRKVLGAYEKAYRIMGMCYKNKYPNEKNLGFYDKLKIRYNIEGLKLTFRDYPSEFALRFIISTVIDWSLDSEDMWKLGKNRKYRKEVAELAKEILGVKEFNKQFVKEKLDLSRDLKNRIDKIAMLVSIS